jgi:hypothetical protein
MAASIKMAAFWTAGIGLADVNFYQTITRRYNPKDSHLQNLSFSCLKCKDQTVNIIILPVLYGCETSPFTLIEELTFKVLHRRIFGPSTLEMQETVENCIMRSYIICTLRQMLLRRSIQGGNRKF